MAKGASELKGVIGEMSEGRVPLRRVQVQTVRGTGRAVVIVRSGLRDGKELLIEKKGMMRGAWISQEGAEGAVIADGRVIELLVAPPTSGSEWEATSAEVETCLESLGVRHCPMIGVGRGSVLVELLAVTRPKLCQVIILADPTVELGASWSERVVARLERWLPLGLPLRMGSDHFFPEPFLHRIRCPVLVVASATSSEAEARHMAILAQRIPNGWFQRLSFEEGEAAAAVLKSFLLVKHRHPMRRGAAALRDFSAE